MNDRSIPSPTEVAWAVTHQLRPIVRIRLRHVSGKRAGQLEVFALDEGRALTIGRDERADVRFHPTAEPRVSRNHAAIEWSNEQLPIFRISDLLSRNGTYVNGRRIGRSALLRPGDRIRLGSDGPELEFVLDDGSPCGAKPAAPAETQPIARDALGKATTG